MPNLSGHFFVLFSDKWLEQFGLFSNTARQTTIKLLKNYSSTNYNALVNINHADNSWTATTTACVSTKTTSSFIAQVYYNNSNTSGLNSWFTAGFS